MNPLLLFILALLIPTLLTLILITPVYVGLVTACYLIYEQRGEKAVEVLMSHKYDMSYMMSAYSKLFDFWTANSAKLDFVDFTLPLFGPPLLGVIITGLLVWKFTAYVVNIFRLST